MNQVLRKFQIEVDSVKSIDIQKAIVQLPENAHIYVSVQWGRKACCGEVQLNRLSLHNSSLNLVTLSWVLLAFGSLFHLVGAATSKLLVLINMLLGLS